MTKAQLDNPTGQRVWTYHKAAWGQRRPAGVIEDLLKAWADLSV